jgi:hypothetical protein
MRIGAWLGCACTAAPPSTRTIAIDCESQCTSLMTVPLDSLLAGIAPASFRFEVFSAPALRD